MKDYCTIETHEFCTIYLDSNDLIHRLYGPAAINNFGFYYYISGICYCYHNINDNELIVYKKILKIPNEYHVLIRNNIENILQSKNIKMDILSHDGSDINDVVLFLNKNGDLF